MSYESTLTSKGQITIPKELRERFELKVGERVVLVPSDEGIVLRHRVGELKRIRGIMRKEVDFEKASAFVRKLRKEWRLE